jgi:NADH dehydrogenase
VVNAAGISFERGRQRYKDVHATGAWAIAEAASAAGVQRLVHISGIGADDRVSRNRFVRSKVEAESSIVAAFPNATILRPSVVFGPEDAFFNKLAAIAAMAPVVPLVGDGSAKLQPVYVGDVARAVVAVLEKPETARSVFELGGPRVYSYRELVALTLREIDRKKPMLPVPAGLMKLLGFFAQFQPALLGPPPITRDQADLLTRDNVVHAGAKTLADLGIEPTAAEAILPTYLDRFRPAGRYNQQAPA